MTYATIVICATVLLRFAHAMDHPTRDQSPSRDGDDAVDRYKTDDVEGEMTEDQLHRVNEAMTRLRQRTTYSDNDEHCRHLQAKWAQLPNKQRKMAPIDQDPYDMRHYQAMWDAMRDLPEDHAVVHVQDALQVHGHLLSAACIGRLILHARAHCMPLVALLETKLAAAKARGVIKPSFFPSDKGAPPDSGNGGRGGGGGGGGAGAAGSACMAW